MKCSGAPQLAVPASSPAARNTVVAVARIRTRICSVLARRLRRRRSFSSLARALPLSVPAPAGAAADPPAAAAAGAANRRGHVVVKCRKPGAGGVSAATAGAPPPPATAALNRTPQRNTAAQARAVDIRIFGAEAARRSSPHRL